MKIGIDITPLQNGHCRRGVGEYARNLLVSLLEADQQNEYVFFGYPGEAPDVFDSLSNFNLVQAGPDGDDGIWRRLKWHQYTMPRLASRFNLDVIHLLVQSFDVNIPIYRPAKMVVTIHDLKALLFPKIYLNNPSKRISYKVMINFAKKADHIITDSCHSKNDIVNKLGVSDERVSVIPLAVDPYFYQSNRDGQEDSGLTSKQYGLEKEFILFVGAIEPSKNIDALLSVYEQLVRQGRSEQLVLVGVQDPSYFKDLQNRFGYLFGTSIRFLDFIPKRDLRALYRLAKFFVYPSLYEGFGLPVLEALASGTPVITSNASSVPEVTGEAAILVDPLDLDLLQEKMVELCEDENARSALATTGVARAREFSWARCASQTAEVYQSLARGEVAA